MKSRGVPLNSELVFEYMRRGWAAIHYARGKKGPTEKDWPSRRFGATDLPKFLNQNVGILTGAASGGLVDVDLDAPQALAIASLFLPPTGLIHGRKSKPRSHLWYVAEPAPEHLALKDPDGTTLLELRTDKHQTMAPPSAHPNGEAVIWDEWGEPTRIDGEDLARHVKRIGAAALMARRWPREGARQDAALALAGALLHGGMAVEEAVHFVRAVATGAADEETEKRASAAENTARKFLAGEAVTGRPTLEGIIDSQAVALAFKWLELKRGSDGSVEDLLRAAGVLALTATSTQDDIEKTLRAIAGAHNGADQLRAALIKSAVLKQLEAAEIKRPAQIVDAAMPCKIAGEEEGLQGQVLALKDPEPWLEPVDGGELLQELVSLLERFVVLPSRAVETVALWIMFTWVLDAAETAPRLAITSPTKRCGKTRLLQIIGARVRRPLPASNVPPAAVFRVIEKAEPTLLIDEADTFLKSNEALRGILNSGHARASAFVIRCVGENFEPRHFSTWASIVIVCIGKLPATLEDRSIEVPMKRKTPGEKVERLRNADLEAAAEPFRRRCLRWAIDNFETLRAADPITPPELDDRATDNWRPLLAIADLAGGTWPAIARKAALELSAGREEAENDFGIQLLADLRELWTAGRLNPRSMTEEVLEALRGLDGRPWADYRRGEPLNSRGLARLLKPFGIRPRDIKLATGQVLKGYLAETFEDVFARYLPFQSATSATSIQDKDLGDISIRYQDDSVADKNSRKPYLDQEVAEVADPQGENEGKVL